MDDPKEFYDSADETKQHITTVGKYTDQVRFNLKLRGETHDNSKLHHPEKTGFDEYTPKLKHCTYGSDEYKQFLKELTVVLSHHYENNSHHPEHYEDGIRDMSLMDLIEMLCDWKAAGERHQNSTIRRSLDINKERFNIPDTIQRILENTARELGWI